MSRQIWDINRQFIYEASFPELPESLRRCIRADLLKIHARLSEAGFDEGGHVDWRRHELRAIRDAYNVFGKYLLERLLCKDVVAQQIVEEVIPQLTSDVLIEMRWSLNWSGSPNRDEKHVERFGGFWVKEGYPNLLKTYLEGRIADWHAEALRFDSEILQSRTERWEDIAIRFVSDFTLEIEVAGRRYIKNYAEMGFEDRRNRTPNFAWQTLRLLAEKQGVIRNETEAGILAWRKVEKRVQEIRSRLRKFFRRRDDPFYGGKGQGYRARFHIGLARSYHGS